MWSLMLVEEDGRDSGWDLDLWDSQPSEFRRSSVPTASDSEAAQVHSATKAHLGNGPLVMTKMTFFFPSWFLAGPWLQPSTHVVMPLGSAFSEPKGRQAE